MEELNKEFEELSQKQNLFPAERIILIKLNEYEKQMQNADISNIAKDCLKSVSSLLNINKGNLSMQCSLSIGEILVFLLSFIDDDQKIVELINHLTENPTESSLYASGFLISKIPHKSDGLMGSFISTLLIQNENLLIPTLYSLSQCFRFFSDSIKEFVKPAFNLAKQSITHNSEKIHLMALKLVMKLVDTQEIEKEEIIKFVEDLLSLPKTTPFVTETTCRLMARVCYSYISKDNEEESMKEALIRVVKFIKYKEIVFSHFLAMLDYDVIERQYPLISGFIVDHCPIFFNMFTKLLTKEAKMDLYLLFQKSDEEHLPDLSLIENLDYDQKTRFDVTALAYDLVVCKDIRLRTQGAQFFTTLYSKDRELAIRYLQSSLLFLADPPEEYPKFHKNIKSKALIASNIISSVDNKDSVLKGCEENINKFLSRVFETPEMLKGEFASAFILMSSLPQDYIPIEDVYSALVRFRKFYKGAEITTPKMKKESLFLGMAIGMFIAAHPYISKSDKTLHLILSTRSLISSQAKLASYLAFPKIQAAPSMLNLISSKLHGDIMTINPTIEYIHYRIKNPMPSKTNLLHGSQFIMPKFPSAFVALNEEDMTIRIVESYSSYIQHIPQQSIPSEISFLCNDDTNILISLILIHCLIQDSKTASYLPEETFSFLIRQLDEIRNVTKLQIIAESLALYTTIHPEKLVQLLDHIVNFRNHTKCLVYGALFSLGKLSEPQLLQMMLDMNNLAKEKEICPFALFSLNLLYQYHFSELSSLNFTNDQCTFIFDILQSPLSLDPYINYFLSQVFTSLLPIISAELLTTRNTIFPILTETLHAFSETKISYAKQVLYMTMKTANQLEPELVKSIHINIPYTRFKSFPTRLNACGVFADLLNFNIIKNEFFKYIPENLVLLQLTNDSRAEDLVLACAHNYASNTLAKSDVTKEDQKLLFDWMTLIYNAIVTGYISYLQSNTKIDAKIITKKCLLKAANVFVKYIPSYQNEETKIEMTKEIILSAVHSINNHEQELYFESFNLLTSILTYLNCDGFYEELAIACDKGFSALDQCSNFCIKFLDHLAKLMKNGVDKYVDIFGKFIRGLDRIIYVPFIFFQISSKTISLLKEYPQLLDVSKLYLNQLTEIIAERITDVMTIFDKDKTNNIDKNELSALFYTWGHVISDFVWLQNNTHEKIAHDILISFCNDEIARSTNQKWRLTAAVNGLIAVYDNIQNPTDDDETLISETLHVLKESGSKLSDKDKINTLLNSMKSKTKKEENIAIISSLLEKM